MLVNGEGHQAPGDLQVGTVGNVLLITATASLGPTQAARLDEALAQGASTDRSIVLDLTAVDAIADETVAVLAGRWRELRDRLRVVAPPGGDVLRALKDAGLRRFAIHSALSGALSQTGGRRHARNPTGAHARQWY